jgi:uncharacterized protein CbrC (UPF0167 family)
MYIDLYLYVYIGRINVAHARKKKRLDEEFERLLQSIDHKRGIINDLDKQGAAKVYTYLCIHTYDHIWNYVQINICYMSTNMFIYVCK